MSAAEVEPVRQPSRHPPSPSRCVCVLPQLSDGSWQQLSATERTQAKERIYKMYTYKFDPHLRVSRSHFLELADMVAGSTQKSYGALDSFAEENGREQAKRLRGYCVELRELAANLLTLGLLPSSDSSDCEAQRAAGAAVRTHAEALEKKVTDVETFIKREMAAHVPSVVDPEPEDDVATCPEHCRACAFGTSTDDASRMAACTRKHTKRCVQCARAHSLQPDFDALVAKAGEMLTRAEAAADAAADAAATGGDVAAAAAAAAADAAPTRTSQQQSVQEKKASFKELQTLLQRALVKIKAHHAHERRAAHEAKVMEMLLRELDETGCIILADWKVGARTHARTRTRTRRQYTAHQCPHASHPEHPIHGDIV